MPLPLVPTAFCPPHRRKKQLRSKKNRLHRKKKQHYRIKVWVRSKNELKKAHLAVFTGM